MKARHAVIALLSVLALPTHAGGKKCAATMACPDHDPGITQIRSASGMTRSNAAMPDPAMTRTQAYGRGQLRTGYDTQGRYWYDYDGASRSRPAAPTQAALVGTSPSRTWHSTDGGSIRVDYQHNDTVRLNFADGSSRLLNRNYSVSGKHYASGEYEWSEADGHAAYRRNGVLVFDGVQNR